MEHRDDNPGNYLGSVVSPVSTGAGLAEQLPRCRPAPFRDPRSHPQCLTRGSRIYTLKPTRHRCPAMHSVVKADAVPIVIGTAFSCVLGQTFGRSVSRVTERECGYRSWVKRLGNRSNGPARQQRVCTILRAFWLWVLPPSEHLIDPNAAYKNAPDCSGAFHQFTQGKGRKYQP